MMEFNKAYNRAAFLEFLKGSFLPEEDFTKEETVLNFPVQTKYCTKATRLGSCHDTLDLEVYEILHTSKHDARVGLSKEAFRLLAEQGCTRALVLFVPQDDNSNYRFSLITIKLFVDENGKVHKKYSNLRRYSYLFGTDFKSEKTLKKYFLKQKTNDENIKRVIDENDLLERFSVEALAKDFYEKLYQWYLWAVDESTGVTFPNKTSTSDDDRDNMNIKIIRMITRLLFVWFIKQKGLVPNEIFEIEKLKNILKDFNPESKDNGNYYNAILQNLFFATLNRAIIDDEGNPRRFANRKDKRDMRNLYRYAEMFNISEDEVLDLFAKIPFLNGGLFECLDKFKKTEIQQNEDVYYDGFSRNAERSANGNLKYRAFVPNILFFNEDEQQPGLINLFSQYNFTIEENSVNDADVSLDPELLGRVFENLLAAYNPETQESARKATGSFYTPREIVNYMVSESLIAHVCLHCNDIGKQKIRKLFEDNEKSDDWTEQQSTEVIQTLKGMRILDPACGSGAFPMGCLLRIVEIIECLQGHTENRYELKLHLIDNCIFGIDIQPIAMLISKLRFFISLICEQKDINFNSPETNYSINTLPNLETKFVAANTLIGADIRNYGDDWTNDEKLQQMQKELLSIRSNHFYARSQYKKEKDREADAAKCDEILSYILENKSKPNELKITLLETQIKKYNEELKQYGGEHWIDEYTQPIGDLFENPQPSLFRHDKNKEKREEINNAIANCKNEIKKEQNKNQLKGFEAAVKQVTSWNPYNQNASSPFFDPEWMFGVKDGFDVVIGNPPYIQLQNNSGALAALYENNNYQTFTRTGDIYCLFYERGWQLLKSKGHLCLITSNKWMRAGYGEKTRQFFAEKSNPILLVDFAGIKIFECATVDTNILLFKKEKNGHNTICAVTNNHNKDSIKNLSNFVKNQHTAYDFSNSSSWVVLSPIEQSIKKKIEAVGTPLKDWDININYGIKTGCNEAFIISTDKRNEILANCQSEDERKRTAELIRPILRGRDIKKYGYDWANLWLIWIPWHFPLHFDNTIQGASEKAELEFERQYSAVYNHLLKYKELLSNRNKAETGIRYEWYALQRWGANYWEDFSKPKIMYPNMTKYLPFYFDEKGFYQNDKSFMITGLHIAYLTAFFNSSIFKFCFIDNFPELQGGTRELRKIFFDKILVLQVSDETNNKFKIAINRLQSNYTKEQAIAIDNMLFDLYGLTKEEKQTIGYITIK